MNIKVIILTNIQIQIVTKTQTLIQMCKVSMLRLLSSIHKILNKIETDKSYDLNRSKKMMIMEIIMKMRSKMMQ
jgi:hypothetical protein